MKSTITATKTFQLHGGYTVISKNNWIYLHQIPFIKHKKYYYIPKMKSCEILKSCVRGLKQNISGLLSGFWPLRFFPLLTLSQRITKKKNQNFLDLAIQKNRVLVTPKSYLLISVSSEILFKIVLSVNNGNQIWKSFVIE